MGPKAKYHWLSLVVFRAGHRIRCFAKQSCPLRSLNSATVSIRGQSGMSESASVHCFFFVRALSFHCVERHRPVHASQNRCPLLSKCVSKLIAFNAKVARNPFCFGCSLFPIEFIADCESESITALVNFVSRQHNWPSANLMASISPSKADLLCPAAA
ncbi:unnamed protein product [Rodentolepis nana]|uniref:Secreted protein n=1 Tax=Rodentolepis nana TaxID=102285 RepID=A0A0R3TMC0_RODNA|nr:unnamed protein product [Rodentolepis nana]